MFRILGTLKSILKGSKLRKTILRKKTLRKAILRKRVLKTTSMIVNCG